MAAVALAILGKRNEPLYLREFESDHHKPEMSEEALFGLVSINSVEQEKNVSASESCSVKHQFILHAALDRLDQIISRGQWRKQGVTGVDAMFVGLLCPIEDLRVYGYVTTTQSRFLLTVQDSVDQPQQVTDQSIKQLLAHLHKLYVEHSLNPFSEINAPIQSKRFDEKVQQCIDSFNVVAARVR